MLSIAAFALQRQLCITFLILGNIVGLNRCVLFFNCGLFTIILISLSQRNPAKLAYFINSLIETHHNFYEKWTPQIQRKKFRQTKHLLIIERFLKFLTTSFHIFPILFFLLTLTVPGMDFLLTSLLPTSISNKPYLLLPVAVSYWFYLEAVVGCYLANAFLIFIAFGLELPLIASEFRSKSNNKRSALYRTTMALRTMKNLPVSYRSLELIHQITLEPFSVGLFPLQAIAGQTVLVSKYMLIRHAHELDYVTISILFFIVFIINLPIWTVLLTCGAILSSESIKTIQSWKNIDWKGGNKYKARFAKSCRPLRIECRGVYSIGRLSVPKYFKGISRGTFRTLLAFK
jgi:hypothetical protein